MCAPQHDNEQDGFYLVLFVTECSICYAFLKQLMFIWL